MKTNPKVAGLAVLLMAGLLSLPGCSSILNSDAEVAPLEESELAIFETEDELAAVEDATLSKDMTLNTASVQDHRSLNALRGLDRHRQHRGRPGMHLGRILRSLSLTDSQIESIRGYLAEYRECVSVPVHAFREANAELMAEAKAERRTILDDLTLGVITREEAKEKMKALSHRVRSALKESAEALGLRTSICECKVALLDNIGSVLDQDQAASWNDFTAKLNFDCNKTDS